MNEPYNGPISETQVHWPKHAKEHRSKTLLWFRSKMPPSPEVSGVQRWRFQMATGPGGPWNQHGVTHPRDQNLMMSLGGDGNRKWGLVEE